MRLLFRAFFWVLVLFSIEFAVAQVSVLTYHDDNARTGQNVQEAILTPSTVNSTNFGKLASLSVQGLVDGQPLYVPNVNINGTLHNVVYVVTEHDMVYAFDADTYASLWSITVVGSGETPSDDRGCDSVSPEIGITATPVIDPHAGQHGLLYLVAATKDSTSQYHERIHAVDLANGSESFGPTEIQATYRNATGTLTFDPAQYLSRAALLLLNGVVYVSFASHCDNAPYNGWIMGYSQTSLQQVSVFQMTPNGSEGAIWMSGGGLAADQSGYIYFLDGNGTFDTTLNASGFPVNGDFGNSFMKLSTSGNTLAAADYFAMSNVTAENAADLDIGSGGTILLPDLVDGTGTTRQLAIGAGKDLNIYVVDRNSMGKFNSISNNIYQEIPAGTGLISGTDGVFSTPAYFNNTVYYGAVNDSVKAFAIRNARLVAPAGSQTSITYGYPGATPAVSANGTQGGILWAVQNGIPGILHAYDATNLATELYNSSQAGTRDQFQNSKFNAPMVANGKVFINGTSGVTVFGLLSSLTAQHPTAALSVSPTSGSVGLTVNASTSGSSDPNVGGSIVSSWIDFGDGTVVNAVSASHQYLTAGTYTVVATVYDNFGTSSSRTATVTVAANSPPFGWVDSASPTTVYQYAPVVVSGWAADPEDGAPVAKVQIVLDGTTVIGNATLGAPRQDVANTYGSRDLDSGWSFSYNVGNLSVGQHTLTAVAYDSQNASAQLGGSAAITVAANAPPFGWLDSQSSTAVVQNGTLQVSGWAADPDDGAPVAKVQLVLDATTVIGNATLGAARPDIANHYGSSDLNSGWTFSYSVGTLPAGQHTITAIAYDSKNAATQLNGSATFTVTIDTPPFGWVDSVSPTTVNQSGSVQVSGWAADKEDGSPVSKVQVVLDNVTVIGNATLGLSRPDVATANGDSRYTNSGWTLSYNVGTLTPGQHTLTAIAYDSQGISAKLQSSATFTVNPPNTAPFGWLDYQSSTAVAPNGTIQVSGWAADQQDGAPVAKVQLVLDGATVVGNATLGFSRPDTGYPNSGWSFTYNVGSIAMGQHTLTAVAYDSQNASAQLQGSATFTVTTDTPPFGWLDSITPTTVSQSGTVQVSGWAADQEDGAPVAKVQIVIDHVAIYGNATLGGVRPDIASAYGDSRYTNSGWTFSFSAGTLSPGQHTISAVAYDSQGISTQLQGSTTLTVTSP